MFYKSLFDLFQNQSESESIHVITVAGTKTEFKPLCLLSHVQSIGF